MIFHVLVLCLSLFSIYPVNLEINNPFCTNGPITLLGALVTQDTVHLIDGNFTVYDINRKSIEIDKPVITAEQKAIDKWPGLLEINNLLPKVNRIYNIGRFAYFDIDTEEQFYYLDLKEGTLTKNYNLWPNNTKISNVLTTGDSRILTFQKIAEKDQMGVSTIDINITHLGSASKISISIAYPMYYLVTKSVKQIKDRMVVMREPNTPPKQALPDRMKMYDSIPVKKWNHPVGFMVAKCWYVFDDNGKLYMIGNRTQIHPTVLMDVPMIELTAPVYFHCNQECFLCELGWWVKTLLLAVFIVWLPVYGILALKRLNIFKQNEKQSIARSRTASILQKINKLQKLNALSRQVNSTTKKKAPPPSVSNVPNVSSKKPSQPTLKQMNTVKNLSEKKKTSKLSGLVKNLSSKQASASKKPSRAAPINTTRSGMSAAPPTIKSKKKINSGRVESGKVLNKSSKHSKSTSPSTSAVNKQASPSRRSSSRGVKVSNKLQTHATEKKASMKKQASCSKKMSKSSRVSSKKKTQLISTKKSKRSGKKK